MVLRLQIVGVYSHYEVVSKVFRSDAVKIIKLTIRPIGRHHHRSSSLLHVDAGPAVSFIFGTLPGSPFLSECQALSAIRPVSSQWYRTGVLSASISFLEIGRSHRVPNQGCTVGGQCHAPAALPPRKRPCTHCIGGWMGHWAEEVYIYSQFIFRQKLLGEDGCVRRDVVMVKQPGLFSPKFGATSPHFFTQSPQNIAVERRIHSSACWDKFFVHNPLNVKESDDHALDIAFHPSGLLSL